MSQIVTISREMEKMIINSQINVNSITQLINLPLIVQQIDFF